MIKNKDISFEEQHKFLLRKKSKGFGTLIKKSTLLNKNQPIILLRIYIVKGVDQYNIIILCYNIIML